MDFPEPQRPLVARFRRSYCLHLTGAGTKAGGPRNSETLPRRSNWPWSWSLSTSTHLPSIGPPSFSARQSAALREIPSWEACLSKNSRHGAGMERGRLTYSVFSRGFICFGGTKNGAAQLLLTFQMLLRKGSALNSGKYGAVHQRQHWLCWTKTCGLFQLL